MGDYDERSSEDLTEEPSLYRLEEMRKKGQVAVSRDLTSAVVFLSCCLVLYSFAGSFSTHLQDYMKELFSHKIIRDINLNSGIEAAEVFQGALKIITIGLLPLFSAAFIMAIVASIGQTQGFVFSTDPINPDLSHVNPLNGFKRLFSMQNAFTGVKSLVKFTAISAVLYNILKDDIRMLPNLAGQSSNQILLYVGSLTFRLCMIIAIVMAALSGIDFLFQWWSFRKKARMTKQEAKQESKERDGDPQIKARIRSLQRDMARKRMMKAVPKADVIVTNPTHIAVAIIYEKEWMAPRVVAKGGDFLAERIKEVARQHGIPIVENKPLARALYKTVKVGQMIPKTFYQSVAEVLAYVYKIKPKDIFSEQRTDL